METKKLKEIAQDLKAKIEAGLKKDGEEILCLPTYISPKNTDVNGQAVVLDLGGTNYRIARVDFEKGKSTIYPDNGWKRDMSEMKQDGYTEEKLLKALADPINEIDLDKKKTSVGYCFSYAAKSLQDGDAELIEWSKGVNIQEMLGKPVGKPLLDRFKDKKPQQEFTDIKVINDTVASLFAGLAKTGYDAYIGLIVGTGNNMAALMRSDKIEKLDEALRKEKKYLPVNLESGNFHPKHLTIYDELVDANSGNPGGDRFEKAISGMYLGEVFKSVYPLDEFEEGFDAQTLTTMLSYPAMCKEEYVHTARWIYERSAQLVAASVAGLILVLLEHRKKEKEAKEPGAKDIEKILLTSEGSLFWSKNRKGKDYSEMVIEELHNLLREFGHGNVHVELNKEDNANLIGTAIAALSS
jgi:hexokinase